MAADITLLKSFVDGQGAGASTYSGYAPDLDANFAAIESTINQLNTEISAIGGQNAPLSLDLLTSLSSPTVATGFVDATSFQPIAFISGDTQIQVPYGVALTVAGRIASGGLATLTGSGTSGTRYIALRADGSITLETATAQGVMDLYSVTWTGSVFTPGTLVRLEEILPAGHDFQNLRVQEDYGQSTDAAIPPYTYDRITDRISDIVRLLGGSSTSADAGQAALGPIAFAGSVSLPGLITGDGSTHDGSTGFYRPAADRIGVSVLATQAGEWAESVANQPQYLARAGTDLTAPPIAWVNDSNTGLGWVSADVFRAVANGLEVMRWSGASGIEQASFVGDPNSGASPGLSIIGDPNTGWLSTVADQLETMVGGTVAQQINPQAQRSSATQGRAAATRSSQNVSSGTLLTNISLSTAEEFDQGAYHDLVTNPDRMTVPTGFDGLHQVTAYAVFDESSSATPNVGDRALAITVNGTTVAQIRVPAAGANDSELSVCFSGELAATDVVRMAVAQDSGNAMDVISSRLSISHSD